MVGALSLQGRGLDTTDAKTLTQLAIADIVRGKDGTGLMYLSEDDKEPGVWFYKEPVNACEFLEGKFDSRTAVYGTRFAVFHNRAATLGELTAAHTHPFSYAGVTGVHNGTVHDWKSTLREYITEAEMDSQAIYEALSKTDPSPEEVGKLLGTLESGAYSLIWWDSRIKRLRFARNSDRPMCMVKTNDTLWFGSELRMLEWVLGKNKINMQSSWHTLTHCVIDIPTEADDSIEVHDFTDDVEWVGRSWSAGNSWQHFDRDWDTPHSGASSSTSKGNSKQEIIVPRYVELLGYATQARVPQVTTADGTTYARMNRAVTSLTGVDLMRNRVTRLETSYKEYLKDRLDGAVVEEYAGIKGALRVCDIVDGKLIGYMIVDGKPVPLSMQVYSRATMPEMGAIEDVLESGKIAVVPRVPIRGVRLYHNGMVAYIGGIPTGSPADVTAEEADGDIIAAALNHPDVASQHTTRVNWNIGWGVFKNAS